LEVDNNQINEIYILIRQIGANFKMSNDEFSARFKMFKKMHLKCNEECIHLDLWYRKMFFQNQVMKLGKSYNKMIKSKIDPVRIQKIVGFFIGKGEKVVGQEENGILEGKGAIPAT
jgi:hypothetical protein